MTYLVDGAASRRRAAHRTDLNELERGFVLSIEAKQTVDVGIHEAGEETRRQTEAVSGGREVRQKSALSTMVAARRARSGSAAASANAWRTSPSRSRRSVKSPGQK